MMLPANTNERTGEARAGDQASPIFDLKNAVGRADLSIGLPLFRGGDLHGACQQPCIEGGAVLHSWNEPHRRPLQSLLRASPRCLGVAYASPSIIPGIDRDTYLILDDFGRLGC